MKKLLVLSLLLASCATTRGRPEKDPNFKSADTAQVETLPPLSDLQIRAMMALNSFFIDSNMCFTSYAICLAENKIKDDVCWTKHEQCVINVSLMYKTIFDRLKQLEEKEKSGK